MEMKRYNVIYADPPWNQKGGPAFGAGGTSKPLPYPTMSVGDLCDLDVKGITADDAHLYMRVTNKYLLKAGAVINAWGFEYSTSIIWEKKLSGNGLGGTFRISHEILLFCRKGKLKALRSVPGTVHRVTRHYVDGRPCHSKKPEYFAHLIESVSPGARLEMFARQPRDGWDVFGNEVEKSVHIPTIYDLL